MENVLTQTRAVLLTTVPRWETLATVVPAELLRQAPAPGEWSAVECLAHLLDAEQDIFPVRIRAFLAGEDFPAFHPDAEGTPAGEREPAAMVAELANLRRESLALLDTVTEADLPRTARHSELGQVTLGEQIHEWAAHDLMHTVQAERALMQPFIAGVGPWRAYFTDHIPAAKA